MHYNLLMPGSKVMYSAAAFRGEPFRVDNKETKTYRQTDRNTATCAPVGSSGSYTYM